MRARSCGRSLRVLAALAVGGGLATLGAAGCAGPRPQGAASREIILVSEDKDRQVGEMEARRVEQEIGLVDDPDLQGYVNAIGQRIAQQAAQDRRFDYAFRIVDQDTPNAFALPGGFIYVSRGLLALASDEDQLANVIAHEIVHVAARHAAARQQVARSTANPLSLPGILVGAVLGETVGRALTEPFQIFSIGAIAAYSRDQEREADRAGQELAARAGYDPSGMATFLSDLENTERIRTGTSRIPSFLDTHPTTPERVAAAASRAQAISWRRSAPPPPDRYLAHVDGLLVGVSASEGVFQEDRFLHPDLDFAVRFPEGWETLNTRRAVGAIEPARTAYVVLEAEDRGDDPERAARAFLYEARREIGLAVEEMESLRIGSLDAYRASARIPSPQGAIAMELTWIAHGGTVYRLTGAAPAGPSRRHRGVFRSVARSFRPLAPEERASITETRLRVVEARAEETLPALGARTGNVWNVQHTAVMNGLFTDASLAEGQLVKVAVEEPYRPRDTG